MLSAGAVAAGVTDAARQKAAWLESEYTSDLNEKYIDMVVGMACLKNEMGNRDVAPIDLLPQPLPLRVYGLARKDR